MALILCGLFRGVVSETQLFPFLIEMVITSMLVGSFALSTVRPIRLFSTRVSLLESSAAGNLRLGRPA